MDKPSDVFDRDREWASLERFVAADRRGATLGLVYGRWRQGKTYLLQALVEAASGTYVTSLQQSAEQNLARFAAGYQVATGARGRVAFSNWEEAFSALLSLGEGAKTPVLVVVDEFPYLLVSNPEIPSLLQALLSPRGVPARHHLTRLVLCGSALSTMRGLLTGTAPLRGRASLELMVHPFSYREAADFWGTAGDPKLSVMLHALVGGTPAYLDMSGTSGPGAVGELDDWVVSALLNPGSAMFREGNILLAQEQGVTDAAGYLSVLAAISQGATRRGQIAAAVGRAEGALAHPLSVLTEAQLITPLADALKQRRTTFQVAEPVLRLHQLVVAPNEARLVRHQGSKVWSEVADTVAARIYGPHFEYLARTWCAEYASDDTLGGTASRVAPTVIACREHRENHEVDVVVIGTLPNKADRIIALGEAKWRSHAVGVEQLERLRHIRDLLGADEAKLLCFSKEGFTPELLGRCKAYGDVELIDPSRLYGGD